MKYKLKKEPEEVLKMAVEAVKCAKGFTDDIEFSPEDACRSEMPFLIEVLAAVIEAGATTLNIPDTVGYVLPYEYGQIIARLKSDVKGIDKCVISTHCHNDLGMAVANSLAGVRNGARQVECTVNGLGERAGNAAMEEIVMAIRTRQDFFGGRRYIDEHQYEGDLPDQPVGLAAHGFRDSAEQGHRRRQCLRARVGHPRGRHPQGADDVRDHDA